MGHTEYQARMKLHLSSAQVQCWREGATMLWKTALRTILKDRCVEGQATGKAAVGGGDSVLGTESGENSVLDKSMVLGGPC